MPFKSRSQEDLFAATGASAASTQAKDTSRDDHSVAMTMTSLLLLRPDAASAAPGAVILFSAGIVQKQLEGRGAEMSMDWINPWIGLDWIGLDWSGSDDCFVQKFSFLFSSTILW